MIRSEAYTATDWAAATPWNRGTSLALAVGAKAVFSLRVWTVPGGQNDTEASLVLAKVPAFRAIPGYVMPVDTRSGTLLVAPPPGYTASSFTITPTGAIA